MGKRVVVRTQVPMLVKDVKVKLEEKRLLDKTQKIFKDGIEFIIPTLSSDINAIRALLTDIEDSILIEEIVREVEEEESTDVGGFIANFLQKNNTDPDLSHTLMSKVPKKWTIYPPMMLINNHDTFDSEVWQEFLLRIDSSWFFKSLLSHCFHKQNVTHIAVNKPIIEQDIMRRPFNLVPIHNDFGPTPTDKSFDSPTEEDFNDAFWCTVVQNGIFQTWAPRYTMFSRGNIKEKTRILKTFSDVKDSSVVDLYAGIGYFTLSYLKLGASHLFCFELNPWSIEGLRRGVEKNGYTYKVVQRHEKFQYDPNVTVFIFNESNEHAKERFEQAQLEMPISHINLGLLPSSEKAWPIALELYKDHSDLPHCDLHIHQNVATADLTGFLDETSFKLLELQDMLIEPLHLEKIKTFAPDVWHICADFRVFRL